MPPEIAFQSAPSHEGELRNPRRGLEVTFGFNPRPRTRANDKAMSLVIGLTVSIRALARGRTLPLGNLARASTMFQSAPSHEGEPDAAQQVIQAKLVSIRALARGRTLSFEVKSCCCKFQSAPSHEGEPVSSRTQRRPRSFNPRPRTRANGQGRCVLGDGAVSIRALARGRTEAAKLAFSSPTVSIRALARGRTPIGAKPRSTDHGFNPRPRTRANAVPSRSSNAARKFQSAPSHEGERDCRLRSNHAKEFQSAPSHEGEPASRSARAVRTRFNPRPRTRANHECRPITSRLESFNPRPRTRANRAGTSIWERN